jgi:AcrR family transcriptional regulator
MATRGEYKMTTKLQAEDRQNRKKQRMLSYFIDATKDIIINEGVEKVSVRKVADLAGYSYATIYNYFNDLNDLLITVKRNMIGDIIEYLQKKTANFSSDAEGLKMIFRTYMAYFFKNPNIFRFFYFSPIRYTNQKTEVAMEEPDFNMMWTMTFQGLVEEGMVKEEEIEVLSKTIIYIMHGMLTLSFSDNGALSQEKANQDLDKIISYLLLKKK